LLWQSGAGIPACLIARRALFYSNYAEFEAVTLQLAGDVRILLGKGIIDLDSYVDLSDFITAVRDALNQISFASLRELAKSMCISGATVWRSLTTSLGFVVKYLHWVPRHLTNAPQ
jgi:hypothetical protein